ncbi:MAG: hypothetical protein GWO08_07840 [Gammaproteobacteria bacterium]|nr:hypothetical protein [Gammaproteobacteria bacterium]NIR93576.1 hypothetical protein [Gammaproteobacteria bacterium]
MALANGFDLQTYANVHHKSLNTLRTHLKSVYRKLGVNSQAELVRILLNSQLKV